MTFQSNHNFLYLVVLFNLFKYKVLFFYSGVNVDFYLNFIIK